MTALFRLMIGTLTFVFGYFVAVPFLIAQDLNVTVEYTIHNQLDDETPALVVTLRFRGSADGRTRLEIPSEWANQNTFHEGIRGLSCLTQGCVMEAGEGPDEVYLNHEPGAYIEVIYDLVKYWEAPLTSDVYYRPILDPGYFHLIGEGTFVLPALYRNVSFDLALIFKGFPGDWAFVNSFGSSAETRLRIDSIDKVKNSLYIGGDFKVEQRTIFGKPLYIAYRGEWAFDVNAFVELAEGAVIDGRGFWREFDTPHYLISMIPIEGRCCSLGGTGLYRAFALFVSPDMQQPDRFKWLLPHELFHNWLGGAIKPEQPEEHMYWFTEGFTEYYARLVSLRSGMITLEEYAAGFNQALQDYYFSPARNYTAKDVEENFWSDQHTQKLPYQQGDILAHNWNARIKMTPPTRSLDNVMFDILESAENEGMKVTQSSIDQIVRRYITGGVLGDTRKGVTLGQTIYPDADALGACFTVNDIEMFQFDLGFTYSQDSAPRSPIVVDVVNPNSPAYAAGLRDGDVAIGYSIAFGNSNRPVTMVIKREDGRVNLEFLPRGNGTFMPQFIFDEEMYARNPDRCLEWFQAN